jgi:RNA polymerase sigma-70 factor (ECF subfamily)
VSSCDPIDQDETLLERYNGGDAQAFEALMQRYHRPLFNFILRFVKNEHTAEELLQDTFLKVIQKSESYQRNSKFSTWLYTIARNLCIDHSRKMKHRRHASLEQGFQNDPENSNSLKERVQGKESNADEKMIAQEIHALIEQSISELSEDQREVFLLRRVQNLPFKQIATITNTSENTVKSRMRYALDKIHQSLRESAIPLDHWQKRGAS